MAHIAESVPMGEILKIENYINHRRLTLDQILRETGASWGINGIMYNADGSFCSHLKKDGEVLNCPHYHVWGLAWDMGPDIRVARLPRAGTQDTQEKNYVGGVCLIKDGRGVETPIYDPAQGGVRGRTAWGMKDGKFCAYCSKDGSADARTPEQLRDLLLDYGWDFCAMGDCGGSSQAVLNGREIKSGRTVRHVLLVWLKRDQPPKTDSGSHYEPAVRAYSRSRDGEKKLSEHFKVKEFACRDKSDPVFVAPGLIQLLEAIRLRFGKPIHIHSGYRTPGYNARVGGARFSQHLYGLAADISLPGVTPRQVADYARQLMPNHGGVGIYQTFTHVDVRTKRADWKG